MVREKRSGFWIIILGAVLLALVLFLVYNQLGALNAAREAAAKERAAIVDVQRRLQQLTTVKKRAQDLNQQLKRCNRLLPPEPNEAELINDIKNYAYRSNVHFIQIRFQKYVPKQGYVEMPFKMVLEGEYHQLLNLLQYLQDGPRLVRIDEVKIGKGREELPVVRVDISGSAFYAGGQ
ncbi:type IV pilus assembly protein PilO [Desulfohalotomaculum tongense]|uniref:type 4a pilus biogenesis protein PilO n=1 Tax=Desulforadius tongensis TaxID=1216062 RepID=UPI00195B1A0C|nr:type 4a pilus biogenesis protein PilO [Desulforadius tongensis]MBM7854065.1 type IV pilus assembly protein PilO [Desulforadius tongensis]